MDGRKDTLSDAALDREIESLLAVDPSPEFLARVRVRVADQPVASSWRWRLPVAAAVAVTAIVVAIVMWRPTGTGPSVIAPVQEASVARLAPTDAAAERAAATPVVAQAPRRSTPAITPQRRSEIDLPEVMIADNEARAYATLVAPGRETHLEASLPRVPDLSAPVEVDKMPKIDPVTLDPIDVKPIVQAALE